MHLFSPLHVQLINACYPPSSALLTSGPDYRPNSQELSRLMYHASNKSGKATKLGAELLKRTKLECRKAQANNQRARASLLITLHIFKALATECRRDISLLSSSLVASVATTLDAMPLDLEVAARVANLFTAWTTYTNGHLIGVDSAVTEDYLSALHAFSRLSSVEAKSDDYEVQNRTRLVGLAALRGAVNSEALHHDSAQFKAQVSAIVRPLLLTVLEAELPVLDAQALSVKQSPTSPYLAEFRSRPAVERRAASIHIHIDGDKGPTMSEVTNACLQVLFSLFDHSNGAQISHIMKAALDALSELKGWERLAHCCWFAQKASEWSQYQYRYAVPTCLVERLIEMQDIPLVTPLHNSLAAMITTVFNSPTPLINLSTSDTISNLITVILRRAAMNPDDSLLPPLVECIASLGSHVYYSDQIQDLAGELVSRLVLVELQGLPGREHSDRSRSQAIRCLLAGLLELMKASGKEDPSKMQDRGRNHDHSVPPITASNSFTSSTDTQIVRLSRRTRISPDTWQDTLTLLCDHDYSIRADYSDVLVSYIRSEIRRKGDTTAVNGVKRARSLADGPIQQAKNVTMVLYGDSATRFLNAMHAFVYILATSSSLGIGASSAPSPIQIPTALAPALNVQPATPSETIFDANDVDNTAHSLHSIPAGPRRSLCTPTRVHKSPIVHRMLSHVHSRISPVSVASASDYAHILAILTAAFEKLPIRALLTGVPFLLALDGATNIECSDFSIAQRVNTVKEVVARVWAVIAKVWGLSNLANAAARAIESFSGVSCLPSLPSTGVQVFKHPRQIVSFPPEDSVIQAEACSGLDVEAVLSALISSPVVQEATGLDKEGLRRRFSHKWTPDSALKDSIEKSPKYDALRQDALSPLLRISPALMQGDNISLQSLSRSARGVGVTDLREALEGRSSMSNLALARPASIATLERTSVRTGGDSLPNKHTPPPSTRRRAVTGGNGEVRDVLKKLGVGKQNNASLLKASFPSLQKVNDRTTPSVPPYSA